MTGIDLLTEYPTVTVFLTLAMFFAMFPYGSICIAPITLAVRRGRLIVAALYLLLGLQVSLVVINLMGDFPTHAQASHEATRTNIIAYMWRWYVCLFWSGIVMWTVMLLVKRKGEPLADDEPVISNAAQIAISSALTAYLLTKDHEE